MARDKRASAASTSILGAPPLSRTRPNPVIRPRKRRSGAASDPGTAMETANVCPKVALLAGGCPSAPGASSITLQQRGALGSSCTWKPRKP
jgi:hypothetical protein